MGIASFLFFSNNADKQTLHRRIIPSNEQMEFQQECWNALVEHLKADLKEGSGYSIYSWLQGSYKFATQLRPLALGEEFDIDLGIYFNWTGMPDDGAFSPLELKEMVQDSLERYKKECEDAKKVASPKTRCNRIHYTGNFHIDVPAYHLDASRDARALATQEDEWEDSDPKAIYVWFKDQISEDIRPRVRRLIRYLKAWATLNIDEGRPSAILLTVLVAECYEKLDDDEAASDDEALTGVLRLILSRLHKDQRVCNPVNPSEVLSARLGEDRLVALIEHFEEFYALAEQALAASTEVASADIWSKAYRHFFPLPESESASFAEMRKDTQIVPVFQPLVLVTATRNLPKGKFSEWYAINQPNEWIDYNQIGPIPKNCKICFKLMNANQLPLGARIEWTVRNQGTEAEDINDLGHLAGTGVETVERSAYRGKHYLDCIIRQFCTVIAVKRIPVIVK